jgi:hypothetical protein
MDAQLDVTNDAAHGHRASWYGFMSVVFVAFALFAAGSPQIENPGEQTRLELAASLGLHGSVALDPVIDTYGIPFDRAERDGKSYADKAPGLSFVGAPVTASLGRLLPRAPGSSMPDYWPLRHLLVLLLVAVPATLFPFVALRRYSGLDVRRRVAVAMIFALCTPLFTYGVGFLSHVPAGLLAVLSFVLLVRPGREDPIPSAGVAFLGGLALAGAVTMEYPTAVFGVVLVPTMLLRRVPVRALAGFALGCAVGIVPCLIYHQFAFGAPWATGYSFKSDSWHAIVHETGLLGVSLPSVERLWGVFGSARRGMFFYCPLLLLFPVGLWRMEKARRYSSLPFVALTIVYAFFAGGFVDWMAGWSAAARHLIPWMLLLVFPVASGIEYVSNQPRVRWLLVPLVALSLVGALLSLSFSPWFPEHYASPFGQLVLPMLAQGFAAPTLFASADLAARPFALAGTVLFVTAATVYAVTTLVQTDKPRVLVPAAMVAVIALQIALLWTAASPLTHEEQKVQSQVLERLGYDQPNRESRGVHVAPW